MPKMKSHSGAKKRVKITGTGRLRRGHSFRSHLLEGKSSERKRRLGREADIHETQAKRIKKLMGL
jgi:large subunit ribosomal protein L35